MEHLAKRSCLIVQDLSETEAKNQEPKDNPDSLAAPFRCASVNVPTKLARHLIYR